MKTNHFKISEDHKCKLSHYSTEPDEEEMMKKDSIELLNQNIEEMIRLQEKLYAQDSYSILIIFQAMDTAGKDGVIKHVMSGLNPQGTQVFSFKVPSEEELNHDYLWRGNKHLPERGHIGIFNRSYYEEVLVVRVHDLIRKQKIPIDLVSDHIWKKRFRQIRDYERYLTENGVVVVKFFLHLSKKEQKERLLERIDDPSKNWKFSASDIEERAYWDQYQKCYEEAIEATSTDYAPWYVVPADKKRYTRYVVSEIIVDTLRKLKLEFPELNAVQKEALQEYRKMLQEDESD